MDATIVFVLVCLYIIANYAFFTWWFSKRKKEQNNYAKVRSAHYATLADLLLKDAKDIEVRAKKETDLEVRFRMIGESAALYREASAYKDISTMWMEESTND